MSQNYGLPGRTRDSKDDLVSVVTWAIRTDCPMCDDDDDAICRHEVPVMLTSLTMHGQHVEQQADAFHAALSLMKVGETKRVVTEIKDYCRLYNEPLPFPTPDTQKERHRGANHDDAA